MVPIAHKIKVQWHTFWLSGLLYCLIEMFVPHKISFFLSHWCTDTTRITLNFNRARSHKHILWTFFFCSSSVSSLVHHYRVCVLQNIYTWNGVQPVHMLVITRKTNVQNPRTNQKMCKKSLNDGEKKENDDDNDLLVERKKEEKERSSNTYIYISELLIFRTFFIYSCKRMRWVCVHGQL
jgi:hypothetical protein